MARTMDDERADLIAELLEGRITPAEALVRELIESNRCAFQETRFPPNAWGGVLMLFRPSAWPPDHYRQPLEAPDPVPPLPGWIAKYLRGTASRLLKPLVLLVLPIRAKAAGIAWCQSRYEATGEELYLWVAVLRLQPRKGTVLPAWMAAGLFRVARDLDDYMSGRDPAQRPPADKEDEFFAWQAAGRWPRAGAEELLTALGFPRSPGRGAFRRVHAQMTASKDLRLGLRLCQEAPRVRRKAIRAAFGFSARQGYNPSAEMREQMRDKDALFAFKFAGKGFGLVAAEAELGMTVPHSRAAQRRLRRARRLELCLPERDS